MARIQLQILLGSVYGDALERNSADPSVMLQLHACVRVWARIGQAQVHGILCWASALEHSVDRIKRGSIDPFATAGALDLRKVRTECRPWVHSSMSDVSSIALALVCGWLTGRSCKIVTQNKKLVFLLATGIK